MWPLILGAAQVLVPLVEKLLPQPGSGNDKMDTVLQSLRVIASKVVASGVLNVPGVSPAPPINLTDDALRGAVEAVLSQLKATGQLNPPPAAFVALPAPSTSTYIFQGTVSAPLAAKAA